MTKLDYTVKVVLCILCVICIVFASAVFATESSRNGLKTEQTYHWILAVIIVSAVLLALLIALVVVLIVYHHKKLNRLRDDIENQTFNDTDIQE